DRRWPMDETYIKIKGQWKYLFRAVDTTGQTIDFLLTASRVALLSQGDETPRRTLFTCCLNNRQRNFY
ncbi:ISYps1 transposase, partial [Serratia marcescens VGH107]